MLCADFVFALGDCGKMVKTEGGEVQTDGTAATGNTGNAAPATTAVAPSGATATPAK